MGPGRSRAAGPVSCPHRVEKGALFLIADAAVGWLGSPAYMKKLRVSGPVGWAVMMVMVGGGVVRGRDLIRPGDGVGRVRIGMRAGELVATVGPGEVVKESESPMPSPTADVRHYPERGFDVLLSPAGSEGTVRCILGGGMESRVRRFRYRSAEGIGMGSTMDEIVRAWGEPEKLRDFSTAGTIVEAAYPSRGITLMLTEGRVSWVAVRAPETAA